MEESSKHLPELSLPAHDWCGLVPGASFRADVVARLGEPEGVSEMANGECLDYKEGNLRITFIAGRPEISKIWLSAELGDSNLIPLSLPQAIEKFGKLKATRRDALNAQIYEGAGIRLATLPGAAPEPVLWMELFSAES